MKSIAETNTIGEGIEYQWCHRFPFLEIIFDTIDKRTETNRNIHAPRTVKITIF